VRRSRLRLHEAADGAHRLVFGARFERPAHEHQRDDEEHGFVAHVGRHRGDERVDERGAGAEGHQRVHVGGAVARILPGAHGELVPGPGHHGRGSEGQRPVDHVGRHGIEPGQPGVEMNESGVTPWLCAPATGAMSGTPSTIATPPAARLASALTLRSTAP